MVCPTNVCRISTLSILTVIVLLLAVSAGPAFTQTPQQVPMEALMPEGSVMIGVVDATWLWSVSEGVRALQPVQQGLKQAEKALGVSLQKDFIQWMGKVGYAITDFSGNEPKVLFVAEVKDSAAFLTTAMKLENATALKGKTKWVPINHWGVPLRRARFDGVQVTTGMIGGYFVLGIGQGVAERAVNAYQKRMVSIAANPAWSKTLSEFSSVSQSPVGWMGINYGMLLAISGDFGKSAPVQLRYILVMGLSESPEELRMDSVSYPVTTEARDFFTGLKAKSQGVTGSSLQEMPEGTFATFMMTNLPGWINSMKQMIISTTTDSSAKQMIAMGMNSAKPIFDALGNITGEFGVALTWNEDTGFGLIGLGETADADTAAASASTIASFIEQTGGSIEQSGTFWNIPEVKLKNQYVDLAPSWGANGKWFTITSNSSLIAAPKTTLVLPAEVVGSDMAEFGNLSFVPPLLKIISAEHVPSDAVKAIQDVQQLNLEKVGWAGWSNIDGQTGIAHNAFVVKNLDWQKAATMFIKWIALLSATSK